MGSALHCPFPTGSSLQGTNSLSFSFPPNSVMLPLVSCLRSLQLWPLLLLASAFSPHSVWSLRSRNPLAARPLCARRSSSASRPVCIWDRISPPERDSRFISLRQRSLTPQGADLRHVVRLRRQAHGARPATPSGFEDGLPSSQYPWAIVWGPTVSDEDGGDTNSANPGFPHLSYTFVSPHGMATVQPNSHSLLHNAGLNLRDTPATLRPFLFGPRGEGKSALQALHSALYSSSCWERAGLYCRELPPNSNQHSCPLSSNTFGWVLEETPTFSLSFPPHPLSLSFRCGSSAVRDYHNLYHYCSCCYWDNIQVLVSGFSVCSCHLTLASLKML